MGAACGQVALQNGGGGALGVAFPADAQGTIPGSESLGSPGFQPETRPRVLFDQSDRVDDIFRCGVWRSPLT